MAAKTKSTKPAAIPVDHLKHADKRTNIPTEELRDMVADQEKSPTSKLYPRDPSLDPQLVWKGKDEQDASDLAVPVVPVYIQEKIQPRAIVEGVRRQAQGGNADAQPSLFSDFNGIDFEKQVDFYHHSQNWSNRMILGDSLLTMTSLAEKEGLKGKVQMIYMDPPYGIKFNSNWQVSTRKRDVKDGLASDLTRQPEQVKAFRDTWELGIHSYLSYLRDRLVVARELLTERGSVFLQIGDENVHLARNICDEVLGSENAISIISVRKTGGTTGDFLAGTTDFILWYARDKEACKYHHLFSQRAAEDAFSSGYQYFESADGTRRRATADDVRVADTKSSGRLWLNQILTSPRIREARTGYFPIEFQGRTFLPTAGEWKTNKTGIQRLAHANRISCNGNSLGYVRFANDFPATTLNNLWADMWGASGPIYVVQTSVKLIERCLLMTTDPGDLVLDPTCGSGTTAYVAEQWGRRWITIDTSRVALALARTRIMSARFPYYLMADSAAGIQKEAEITGQPPVAITGTEDIKRGFVYKRVSHITLKSIANNEEIDAIHERRQKQLEPLRSQIQQSFKTQWEEWEIPREAEKATDAQKTLLAEWWKLRRERQAEIDASIARRAEVEMLYDQPYEDPKRVRVAGPFTVESLSPHRVLSTDEERPAAEVEGQASSGQYETMVLDNLRKAGVQNTFKNERLKFDRLEPFAGEWLQAAGEYTDASGENRRVAVSIGPQYGTVGPEQVKEAAKEAVRGIGYDTLVVCGFAFDPHVSEEGRRYGKLTVLPVRMNADLLIGDELLKKTGAGNLFTVFGEPDVRIEKQNGKVRVKLEGLDVYDPTTGEIRPSGPGEIACWFIDTDYNEESFFVRHAYFTGSDQPYEKLKRALRADIDEAAWSALYSTTSQEFAAPSTGKIAVKVINHYGDEVLKVFSV